MHINYAGQGFRFLLARRCNKTHTHYNVVQFSPETSRSGTLFITPMAELIRAAPDSSALRFRVSECSTKGRLFQFNAAVFSFLCRTDLAGRYGYWWTNPRQRKFARANSEQWFRWNNIRYDVMEELMGKLKIMAGYNFSPESQFASKPYERSLELTAWQPVPM